MICILDRQQIAEGVFFSAITDKRYKTNRITVNFYTDIDDSESRSDYAAAAYILTESCKKYPTHKALSEVLLDLYDAGLTSSTTISHATQRCSTVSGAVLDDRYALNGEELVKQLSEVLCMCIFDPLTNGEAFDKTASDLMKGELLDTIDSVINDKGSYAAENAAKTAYVGEPLAYPINGTHEQAEQVTPESAYAAYKKIMATAHVEICAAGCSDFEDCKAIFAKAFEALHRNPADIIHLREEPSAIKPEPVYITDKMPMQQAILRMYLKTPEVQIREANKLLGMILGGTATSRFFENVREKQSLCYYCNAGVNSINRTMICSAGVEPANVKKTRAAILAEIKDIRENGVSEEELERAKRELLETLSSLYDSNSGLIRWYLSQITEKEFLSPDEYAERIKGITARDVQKAAEGYTLDTVYVLMSEDYND